MPFSPGTRFGPYEVAALIGVGGMGEVYRAADATLKRDVAIKVLPELFANDADSLARFQREAEMLAALNHQNIAHVYGLERAGTTTGLVMELVDGPTLAERIALGAIPLAEAMPIATQIADALDAAHERGIVHRDLKPANVKLRADGTAKVLDFGIAKALQPIFAASGPQQTHVAHTPTMTQLGMILGTAAYMSPEQARGKAVDKRADVWAFGCVLYEMLAGKPAFAGEDATTTVSRVLERDVDLGALPRTVPPAVRQTLKACLQKDPRKRARDIGDVKLALEGAFETRTEEGAAARAAPAWRRPFALAAAFAAGAAVIALAAWRLWPAPEPRAVTRLSMAVSVPSSQPLVAVSPDGRRVGYRSGDLKSFRIRDLDSFETRTIAAEDQLLPCFSPDGEWIAYTAGDNSRSLRKMPLSGGAAVTIAQGLDSADWCDWADDGYLYFSTNPGIMRVREAGGTAELVAKPSPDLGELVIEKPQLLPGGKQLLYSAITAKGLNASRTVVLNLATQERKTLLTGIGYARFVPATRRGASRGYLVYWQNGALFAAPLDLRRLEVGGARPVADGVLGSSSAAVSAAGTLAYLSGSDSGSSRTHLIAIDRDGTVHPLPEQPHLFGEVAYSPDGRRAATTIVDPQGVSTADLWVYDIDGERLTRLTFEGVNISAVWTPDGQRLIYLHSESLAGAGGKVDLRSVPADSSGAPATVAAPAAWMRGFVAPSSVSADGKALLVTNNIGDSSDVLAIALDGGSPPTAADAAPREIAATGFRETSAKFSPDGRFVAYTSNESGRDEVYVVPYPGPGGKSQVSRGGGSLPRWNRNGRELFYVSAGKLVSVEVATTPNFRALTPRDLFAMPQTTPNRWSPYDVSPDGTQFLVLEADPANAERQTELRVVVNWIDELERGAPPQR
jgi:Tol biopolymer transport system component